MSSTSSLNRPQQTALSSAELVQQQILSVNQQIQGLGQDLQALGNEVRNLVAQLQALQPPTAPTGKVTEDQMRAYQDAMARYQAEVARIRGAIDSLNAKSQQIANKIEDLQNKVRRLEGGDLPDAQRRDAERQEKELKAAREQYEGIAKAVDGGQTKSDADQAAKADVKLKQMRVTAAKTDSSSSPDQRLSVTVRWRNTEVKVDEKSDLKTLVRAFSLHLSIQGDASGLRRNPAIGMPDTPGVGLPYHVEPVTSS